MIARLHRYRRPDRRRQHWDELSPAEQKQAVLDLFDGGMPLYTIAHATGLSIEAIRKLAAECKEAAE